MPDLPAGCVVRERSSPQGEAAVPPARTTCDLASLVEPDTEPGARENVCAGATGYAAADDRDIDMPRDRPP